MIETTACPAPPILADATVSVRATDRIRIDRLAAQLVGAELALAAIPAFGDGERIAACMLKSRLQTEGSCQ
jgi:hypothetical protein